MNIPISTIVEVNPSVLTAGGNAPILSGVFLSNNTLVPTNQVLTFATPAAVGQYFGQGSQEYTLANNIYFNGYDNSFTRPGALLIAPYNAADRTAFVQSAFLTGMTLTELQGFSGTIRVTVDGAVETSSAINLSGATSFSNAASLIQTGFGGDVLVTWNATNSTFVFSSTTSGATSTMTYVEDVSGTLAEDLMVDFGSGAILSQGADADTPATAIANLVFNNISWCTVTTLFEPSQANKLLFAEAISDLNNKFAYIYWDTDAETIVANSEDCTQFLIQEASYNNSLGVSGDAADCIAEGTTLAAAALNAAVGVQGFVASIDFTQTNGRATLAFKSLSGLLPTVFNQTSAANLLSNGYNYYGSYANASNNFVFYYNGALSGIFRWIDSFYGQVYLNAQLQTSLMETLIANPSIPYNSEGYTAIKISLSQNIQDALNFGTIRTGVTLSATQKVVTTSQAGLDISSPLFTQGYYLQVLDPGAVAREARQSPIINFWYMDGQSIQQIVMQSIDVL
jgi:hypothetical protein